VGEREDLERFREAASRGALAADGIILSSQHPTPELKGRADYVTLDLAWVAAGVFDGFFELALSSTWPPGRC
jgi:hypothetical protein